MIELTQQQDGIWCAAARHGSGRLCLAYDFDPAKAATYCHELLAEVK